MEENRLTSGVGDSITMTPQAGITPDIRACLTNLSAPISFPVGAQGADTQRHQ